MNRFPKSFKAGLASMAVLGLALGGATAAGAVSAYEHINYGGGAYGGTDRANVGSFNDKTSSVRTYELLVRFHADAGYLGSRFTTRTDYNDLGSIGWNDRISSWDTYPYNS